MRFVRRQIVEIGADPALRAYGAALALANVVTAVYWLFVHPVDRVLDPALTPVCWPFIPNCETLRLLSPMALTVVVLAFLFASAYNAALFAIARSVTPAYWLLVGLSLLKASLLFQDYRLILNQHYMAYWIALPFLFVGDKRRLLRYLVASFYFWAGTLKLNHEWLSGLGLYGQRPFDIPESLIPAACAYVVVLELLVVFGLFARRELIFWAAFCQLVAFHIGSFWVVGFFYPMLMFLLLAIFPLSRYIPEVSTNAVRASVGVGPLWRGREHPITYLLLAVFCLAQFTPFMFSRDPSLTGEGRMFALHMFDAPVECKPTITVRPVNGEARIVSFRAPLVTERLSCDPLVYFYLARGYCRDHSSDLNLAGDIDLVLESRKKGTNQFRTVVSIPSFCATSPTYTPWHHNWWIHINE